MLLAGFTLTEATHDMDAGLSAILREMTNALDYIDKG